MRRHYFMILLIFSSGCSHVLSEALYDVTWIHAHEEDSETHRVYRPSNYNFPRSRGREGLTFYRNGAFELRKTGKTDRPEKIIGDWELNKDLIKVTFSEEPLNNFTIRVIQADSALLIIEKKNN